MRLLTSVTEELTESESTFELPDSSIITATHMGTLTLTDGDVYVILKDVRVIEELPHNIISVSQISKHTDYYCRFDDKYAYIGQKDGELEIRVGRLNVDNVYMGNINLRPTNNYTGTQLLSQVQTIHNLDPPQFDVNKKSSFWNFHIGSNHMALKSMMALYQSNRINAKPTSAEIDRVANCQICLSVNTIAASHNSDGPTPIRRIERLHLDMMGPFHFGGKKQYITSITDGYSKYLRTIVTDNKAVTTKVYNELQLLNNKFPGERIGHLRTDNAPEFPSADMLTKLGIEKDVTPAYLPSANGTAERQNRTIINQIKKLILQFPDLGSSILLLLPHVVNYVTAILNNTPKVALEGRSPREVFEQTQRRFTYKPFGQNVHVKVENDLQLARYRISPLKEYPSTAYGSFIGYGTDYNTYKILIQSPEYHEVTTANARFVNGHDYLKRYIDARLAETPLTTPETDEILDSTNLDHFLNDTMDASVNEDIHDISEPQSQIEYLQSKHPDIAQAIKSKLTELQRTTSQPMRGGEEDLMDADLDGMEWENYSTDDNSAEESIEKDIDNCTDEDSDTDSIGNEHDNSGLKTIENSTELPQASTEELITGNHETDVTEITQASFKIFK